MAGSMFEQFETDKKLEEEGVWLDYGDFRVLVAHAGGSNKKYVSYAEAKTKPFRRAIAAGTMNEERSKGLLFDIYAHAIIKDWQIADGEDKDGATKWKRGIHKKGGGVLDFTADNVVATFKLLPNLFMDIQQSAEGIALFRKEDLEDEAKNS